MSSRNKRKRNHQMSSPLLSSQLDAEAHRPKKQVATGRGRYVKKLDDFFDLFSSDADELAAFVTAIFDETGVSATFKLSPLKLEAFLQEVKNRYRPSNPYHNWNHACHVTLNCFRFIRPSLAKFSKLDVFVLLVSAICHDVDHHGVSNAELVENKTPLAQRYANCSVLENHSIDQALEILHTPETSLFDHLSNAEQKFVETMIRDLIICTDITVGENIARVKAEAKNNWAGFHAGDQDYGVRLSILRLVLLCADVGIACEPFPVFISGARQLFLEMKSSQKGSSATPTDFYNNQVKFIDNYAIVMYNLLGDSKVMEDQFSPLMSRLQKNRRYWIEYLNSAQFGAFVENPESVNFRPGSPYTGASASSPVSRPRFHRRRASVIEEYTARGSSSAPASICSSPPPLALDDALPLSDSTESLSKVLEQEDAVSTVDEQDLDHGISPSSSVASLPASATASFPSSPAVVPIPSRGASVSLSATSSYMQSTSTPFSFSKFTSVSPFSTFHSSGKPLLPTQDSTFSVKTMGSKTATVDCSIGNSSSSSSSSSGSSSSSSSSSNSLHHASGTVSHVSTSTLPLSK